MSLKERVSGGGSDARVTRPHPVSNVRFGPYSSAPATPHRSVSQLTRPTNQTIRAADQLSVDHSMFGYEMRRFDFRCCRTDDLLLFPREGDLNDPDLSHAALRKGDAALLDRYQASIIARTKAQLSVKAPSSEASDYASSKSGRSTSKTSLRTSISTPPTFACRNQNPKSTNPRVPVDAGKPPNQATAFPSSLRSARPTEVVGPAEDSAKTDPPACDSPVKDVETKELCGSPLCDKAVKSDESLPEVPKDAWNLISKSWDSTVRVCPLPPFDEEDETIHLNISTLLPQESGYSLTFPEPSSSATPSSISTGGDSSFTPSKSSGKCVSFFL